MKSIRKGVFETNSSSSHSITLIKGEKEVKMKPGVHSYKCVGAKPFNPYGITKLVISTEYEKMCAYFDLLMDKAYFEIEYENSRTTKENYTINLGQLENKAYNRVLDSKEYEKFLSVLRKHGIEFKPKETAKYLYNIEKGITNNNKPITWGDSGLDFCDVLSILGSKSIEEMVETFIFDKNIAIEIDISTY